MGDWLKDFDALHEHPHHGFFESTYEGKKLHYWKKLPPKGTPIKAILVYQHGIHGHSLMGMKCRDGRYTEMALRSRAMTAAGIAVYAHDQLGHGFSEGARFYIPNGDWTINRNDLVKFARLAAADKAHDENTPLFLSGDSYGGCLAFHASHVLQEDTTETPIKTFKGCALNCPALAGDMPAAPVVWFLRYGLAPFIPTWTPFFMPHPISADRIWKEEEVRAHSVNPENRRGLSNGGVPFCLGTAVGLVDALQASNELFSTFRMPFHINHGNEDHGVPISGSQLLMEQSLTPQDKKELNVVEGGYHALLCELDAEKTIQHEIDWILKMINATETTKE